MGSRANYVVVAAREWRLYYSHWGAQQIDVQLAAGPAHALAVISAQQRCDPASGWLDDVWAEGGALLDVPRHRLLFFGGLDLLVELAYRRAYFALLAETWPGWDVDWAYGGVADLGGCVGVDPEVFRDGREPDRQAWRATAGPAGPEDLEGDWALLTVQPPAGPVRGWAVPLIEAHPLGAGVGLLDLLQPGDAVEVIDGQPPQAGLHADLATRSVGWWTTAPAPGLGAAAASRWPGWRVEFWADRYERQVQRCAGAVQSPRIDLAAGFDQLVRRLAQPGGDPVAAAQDIIDRLRSEGRIADLTPAAGTHVQVDLGPGERPGLAAALRAARTRLLGDG